MDNLPQDANRKKILVVYHSLGGTMAGMAKNVADGVSRVPEVEVTLKNASKASLHDLLGCNGLAIGSPEYFGYMAGAMKDFFDRTYEEAKDRTFRLPYVLFVCAGNDGRGAIANIERIANGYKWKKVAEPMRIIGQPDEAEAAKLEELGETLAAGVDCGIF